MHEYIPTYTNIGPPAHMVAAKPAKGHCREKVIPGIDMVMVAVIILLRW